MGKITIKQKNILLDLLRTGNYTSIACAAAGISSVLFHNSWLKGKNGDPSYTEFYQEVEAAMAEAESGMLGIIRNAALAANWRAAAWLLEHRYPNRWRTRTEDVIEESDNKPQITVITGGKTGT